MNPTSNRTRLALSICLISLVGCTPTHHGPGPGPVPPEWTTAFEPSEQGALLSAWGPSSQDVWSVGGQLENGIAWRRLAGQWNQADVPQGVLLNWVHGVGDTVWMVGNGGRIIRKNGESAFEVIPSPTEQPLWGVWAAGSDQAWAVGGDPLSSAEPDPVIIHWDGSAWSTIDLPEVDRTFRAFFKVWGTGPDNVYAVGSKGIILHFDGQAWTQEFAGTARDFVSLWGTGPDDIIAVGGRRNGMLARWNGESWSHEVLPGEPGLNGVWVNADGVAWAVGERGRILRIENKDFATVAEESDNRILLHGVFGAEDGYRVTVGGTLGERPPWRGVALEKIP